MTAEDSGSARIPLGFTDDNAGVRPDADPLPLTELDAAMKAARMPRESGEDLLLSAWLGFISRDIEANPSRLILMNEDQVREIIELTRGVEFDLNAPLEGEEDGSTSE